MRGSSVLHCLPEFTQTHVHWVGDAIQPSSAASFPFAFNLYQHQIIFAAGGQSIGTSASALVLSMSIRDWFPRLTGLISLQSKGLSKVFSRTTVWKYQFSAFFMVQLSHPYLTTGQTIALTVWIFVSKVMSLLFNMLSSFVITFLPRSKHLLVSWLQSLSTVILEPKKIKSVLIPKSTLWSREQQFWLA